jgi:hypothetical protein
MNRNRQTIKKMTLKNKVFCVFDKEFDKTQARCYIDGQGYTDSIHITDTETSKESAFRWRWVRLHRFDPHHGY